MTYQEIINNQLVNKLYLKIDRESTNHRDHSIKHRDNVIDYCKKLI